MVQSKRLLTVGLLLLLAACGSTTAEPTAVLPTAPPIPSGTGIPPTAVPPTAVLATVTSSPTATRQELAPPPSFTVAPSATPTAEPSATPTTTPTAVPPEALVNGLPIAEFVVLPTAVQENIRAIHARGQSLGRNPYAFSKIGDSVVLTPHYLARFDSDQYNLGLYEHLQPTIDQFAGSFSRYGQVAHVGLSARTLFELGWADAELCLAGENAIDCEIRLHNPSLFLIRLGTNDTTPAAFTSSMRQLLDHLLAQGIIPILGTKADRFEGEENTNNEILRELAAEYQLPLWDFDRIADTLPDRGLSGDAIHLTMSGDNNFNKPEVLQKGYAVSDLTALMMLDAIRRAVEPTAVTTP